jgi:predicted GNAT family acetyltransferase
VTALRTATEVVRPLDVADLAALRALVDAEPYANAVIAARLDAVHTLDPELLGVGEATLSAACYAGGTLLPIGGDAEAWTALAAFLGARRRPCSSIVGPAETLSVLWPELSSFWGAARVVRPAQPLLVLDRPASVSSDPLVRPAHVDELDSYLPAAAAMFAEELGIAPLRGPKAHAYRARLAEVVAAGRALVRTDAEGQVVFKADIAAVSRHTAQVQGVWVRPDRRGLGIATGAMAAVIDYALRLAPSVSLYVNDFNRPARRLYERLGMRQVGTLSTVLF